jgi:hypothetical protein
MFVLKRYGVPCSEADVVSVREFSTRFAWLALLHRAVSVRSSPQKLHVSSTTLRKRLREIASVNPVLLEDGGFSCAAPAVRRAGLSVQPWSAAIVPSVQVLGLPGPESPRVLCDAPAFVVAPAMRRVPSNESEPLSSDLDEESQYFFADEEVKNREEAWNSLHKPFVDERVRLDASELVKSCLTDCLWLQAAARVESAEPKAKPKKKRRLLREPATPAV